MSGSRISPDWLVDRSYRDNMRHRSAQLIICSLLSLTAGSSAAARQAVLNVRITSPLGRSGQPGTVRIVAQVRAQNSVVEHVRFFVDGKMLRDAADGPPYATEWVDENPFAASEISVEAADDHGNSARDRVVLKPLEIEDESHVASVLLEAAVEDPKGRFVGGLKATDFRLSEDGVAQQLDMFRQEEVPTTFTVLMDSSQSMAPHVEFVRDAAARLASHMRPQDRMLVVPFSRHLGPVTGPTNDVRTVTDAVESAEPHGGTAIVDSLIELSSRLSNVEGRRTIVLITDGYDEHSKGAIDDALHAVKAAHATVYVVGIGGIAGISIKGEYFLRQLARETGGRMFLPYREEDLPNVHDLIAADVQHQYVLTYTPSNQEVDGTWRRIAVAVNDPHLKVRTRSGYFAPKPAPIRPSLEFTITDSEDRFLEVAASDVEVRENGAEQSVDTFEEAVSPVSIILALDTSGSMRKTADAVKDAARRFVGALRPQDKMGLVLFSDRSELVQDLASERDRSLAAIDEYKATGGTALYDALSDSFTRLKREEGRRVVVVLTDGKDEDNPGKGPGSTHTLADVLKDAQDVDSVVFGIGLGASVDRNVLQTLAAKTGGEAYFPDDPSVLDAVYKRILENLRRRWIIRYTSTNPLRDGAWRPVEITTRYPGAVVHSRGGYFAPGK
jgi:Ca-activated chloride channel family protein